MLLKQSQMPIALACLLMVALAETVARQTARTATLPNVVVQTQEGRRVRFYDDLVKDKVVLINFMFTSCTNQCPLTTANLVKVADQLGDRLGRSVRMISVTLDPKTDSSDVLRAYAERYATKPGWYFVTGRREDLEAIRVTLGMREETTDLMRHTGMLIYGDDATGQWAATPALAQPRAIVRSVLPLVDRHASD